MKLQSELDLLLATARELVQAEEDAVHQITQRHAALTSRPALLLTRNFGLDLAPHAPLIKGCPLNAVALAETLGVKTISIYFDMALAAERLR